MKNGESCGGVCSMVASFLLGGVIGGGIVLLVAPVAGKEARKQIVGLAEGVKEKAENYYDQIREAVTSVLEDGKGLIEEKKRLISKAVQAGIETYEKEKKGTA